MHNSRISKFMENYFLIENYVNSEGVGSRNVLYHHPLPIGRYINSDLMSF